MLVDAELFVFVLLPESVASGQSLRCCRKAGVGEDEGEGEGTGQVRRGRSDGSLLIGWRPGEPGLGDVCSVYMYSIYSVRYLTWIPYPDCPASLLTVHMSCKYLIDRFS